MAHFMRRKVRRIIYEMISPSSGMTRKTVIVIRQLLSFLALKPLKELKGDSVTYETCINLIACILLYVGIFINLC